LATGKIGFCAIKASNFSWIGEFQGFRLAESDVEPRQPATGHLSWSITGSAREKASLDQACERFIHKK